MENLKKILIVDDEAYIRRVVELKLKNKGFINKGFDADLIVLEKIPDFPIKAQNFITKAKYTPFEEYPTSVSIWKVFLRGIEINASDTPPKGKILLKKLYHRAIQLVIIPIIMIHC